MVNSIPIFAHLHLWEGPGEGSPQSKNPEEPCGSSGFLFWGISISRADEPLPIPRGFVQSSEGDLQPQLHQPTAGTRDQPGNMTGASREDVKPRGIKMGLVQEIKNLRPQLHTNPVVWFEELVRGKIEVVQPGPRDRISSQVAIGSCRRP